MDVSLKRVLAICCLVGLSLFGCTNSVQPESHDHAQDQASAITIDNAGLVPILGDTQTRTVIFVHNNSNVKATGLTFTTELNNIEAPAQPSADAKSLVTQLKLGASKAFIDPVSATKCSTIEPLSYCALDITTPANLGTSSQGSVIIKISYPLAGKLQTFSNIINYARVYNNNTTNGAQFASGVELSSFGNPSGCATVYLYGSGQNAIYNIQSLTTDKPAVVITQGNISGQQLQSNFVQAVEVCSPALNAKIIAEIKIVSTLGDQQYASISHIGVIPITPAALLTTSLVPLIDSATANPGGTLYITNAGNEAALIGTIVPGTGISNLGGTCSETSLPVGASCVITFTVTQAGNSSNITIPYTYNGSSEGHSAVANVTWYNGKGGVLLQMSAVPNHVLFNATESGNSIITVTNIGGHALNDVSIPAPVVVRGSAAATLVADSTDTCSGTSLAVGDSCTYTVSISDSRFSVGQINVSIKGNTSLGEHTRVLPITYEAVTFGAVLLISPVAPTMIAVGDNIDKVAQTLTISNNGTATAHLTESPGLTDNPVYLQESPSSYTCGSTLSVGASCLVTLVLGPSLAIAVESGTAKYTLTYRGGETLPGTTVYTSINYIMQANSQALSLQSVTATGNASGDGESPATAYLFNGHPNGEQTLTLTVKNTGTHAVTITGIQDTNSAFYWHESAASSTCFNASLNLNDTCELSYKSIWFVSAAFGLNNLGSAFSYNFTVPQIAFKDNDTPTSQQFQITPALPAGYSGGSIVYVNGTQATLSNSMMQYEAGTANESVTVQHLLANASGYAAVTVETRMENYFMPGQTISSPNCTELVESGIMTQTCTLIPDGSGTATGLVSYFVNTTLVESGPLQLGALFKLVQHDQGVSMIPIAESITLSAVPN